MDNDLLLVCNILSAHAGSLHIPILQLRQSDLGSAFLKENATLISNITFDVILFNPPYVPTPDDEINGNGIEISWAGGVNGRRIIDRFLLETSSTTEVDKGEPSKSHVSSSSSLSQLSKLLSKPNGICYMITVDDNEPEELSIQLLKEQGLASTTRMNTW